MMMMMMIPKNCIEVLQVIEVMVNLGVMAMKGYSTLPGILGDMSMYELNRYKCV